MICQFKGCDLEATMPLSIDLPTDDETLKMKTFKSNVCETHWTMIFIANEPIFTMNAINNGDLKGEWI